MTTNPEQNSRELPEQLASIETSLRSLEPAPDSLRGGCILYEAGRAVGLKSSRRTTLLWQASTCAVAALFLVSLSWIGWNQSVPPELPAVASEESPAEDPEGTSVQPPMRHEPETETYPSPDSPVDGNSGETKLIRTAEAVKRIEPNGLSKAKEGQATTRQESSTTRLTRSPNYHSMFAKADLVVIASPLSRTEVNADLFIPNILREGELIPAVGIQTRFSPAVILRGELPRGQTTFVLFHLREAEPSQADESDLLLVDFPLNNGLQFLMFLRSCEGGSFEPLTGQSKASRSIYVLQ